jgi:RNA polymerase sigma factor (sigma-70 family)
MELSPSTPSHEVLLQHAAWVRRLARELVHDRAAAEDLAQDTWLALLRARPAHDGPMRPWLARVARNRAALRLRRASARSAREHEAARPEAVPSAEELVGRMELQRQLVEVVLALAEPYRGTIFLRFYEGLSAAEIAASRGCPESTVRSQLTRGLELLRARLDADHGGDRSTWATMLAPLLDVPLEAGAATTAQFFVSAAPFVWLAAFLTLATGLLWYVSTSSGDEAQRRAARSVRVDVAAVDDEARGATIDSVASEGSAPRRGATPPREPSTWRLVDPQNGQPLAAYTLEPLESGVTPDDSRVRWTSDANGLVVLPVGTESVVPTDHPRLAVDVRGALARVLSPLVRAAQTLPPADNEVDEGADVATLVVPAGPTFGLQFDTSARFELADLDARLVASGRTELLDDGLTRQVAPVRAQPAGNTHRGPWVRFGAVPAGADAPSARWTLEVRDGAGFVFGTAALPDVLGAAIHDVRVPLAPTGTVRGVVTGIDAEQRAAVALVLHSGEVTSDEALVDGATMRVSGDLPLDGRFDLRWLAPGTYTLALSSVAHQRWTRVLTVEAGTMVEVDAALVPKPPGGRIAGDVRTASGGDPGKSLVFLFDATGGLQSVETLVWQSDPARSGAYFARFEFPDLPAEPYHVEVVTLARALPSRAEPAPVTAPRADVSVVLQDLGPALDVELEALDAVTGEALETIELVARLDGGHERLYIAGRDEGGARSWLRVFGRMRWGRTLGAAPLVGLPDSAELRWTVRAPGYTPLVGDRGALEVIAPGRARLVARLRRS